MDFGQLLHDLNQNEVLNEFNKLRNENYDQNHIPRFHDYDKIAIIDVLFSYANICGLQRFVEKYPTKDDVASLRATADKLCSSNFSNFPSLNRNISGPKTITYTKYLQLRDSWPEDLQSILSSKLFAQLNRGQASTLAVDELFNYLNTLTFSIPHIKVLLSYDKNNSNVISRKNFEQYVRVMAGKFYSVREACENNSSFMNYYVDFVTNMIFPKLDTLETQYIQISKLIQERLYHFFVMIDPDEDSSTDSIRANTFSVSVVMKYVSNFKEIDTDNDGLVDADDIMKLNGVRWCRSFAESLIGNAVRPDFGWYVKIQSAYDSLGEPWANTIFFDIMDLDHDGYITEYEIATYYKEVVPEFKEYFDSKPESEKRAPPSLSWITNEIFDMFDNDGHIPKDKFVESRITSGVIKHLVDVRGFILWETSEDILMSKRPL